MEISGRLTANATVRQLSAIKSVVNFTVAQDTSYTSKENGRVKRANYFEVGYWGSAKVAKHLNKGTAVSLEGNLSVDYYITKDGVVKPVLRFTPTFSGINILSWDNSKSSGDRNSDQIEQGTTDTAYQAMNTSGSDQDDLPF